MTRAGYFRRVVGGLSTLAIGTLVAVAPAAANGATSGATSSATPPHLTVTPSTALVDLQSVHVAGQHFPANGEIVTVQCRKGATGPQDCDLGTVFISPADSSGSFVTDRYVRRILNVGGSGGGTQLDCAHAPGACVMAGADITSPHIGASVPLSFNPKVPPKKTSMTVTPASNLRDHELVKLVGGGLAPNGQVTVIQCAPGTPSAETCDQSTLRVTFTGAQGGFYLSYPVHRLLLTGTNIVDCATVSGHCQLVAAGVEGPSGLPATVALSFSPKVPTVSQNLFVFPNGKLKDKQLVTVSGNGFTPATGITIVECTTGATSASDCDVSNFATATSGFVGHFAMEMAMHRFIATVNGVVDCASAPGACQVTAVNYQRYLIEHAGVPLTFDPKAPPAKPTITVSPTTNLHDNEAVAVHGTGFTPLGTVQVSQCTSSTINGVVVPFCSNTVTVTADRQGDIASTFFVHAAINGPKGLVACNAKPGRCTLGVGEGFSPVPAAQAPLSFGTAKAKP